MNMSHWSFKATRQGYDGFRVLKEAKEEGLEVFEVRKSDSDRTYWFATESFIERLKQQGIHVFEVRRLMTKIAGNGDLIECSLPVASGFPEWYYTIIRSNDAKHVHELVLLLENKEHERHRFTVVGYK